MAIDKKLFYASDNGELVCVSDNIHPVAKTYTDMEVKEKFFTKDEIITILTELLSEIEELKLDYPVGECTHPLLKIKTTEYQTKTAVEIKHDCAEIIQQKLNALKEEDD